MANWRLDAARPGSSRRCSRVWTSGIEHLGAPCLAVAVGIPDAAWPTEAFTAEERRSLSQIAALAEPRRADADAPIEVVKFKPAKLTMREGGARDFSSIPAAEALSRRGPSGSCTPSGIRPCGVREGTEFVVRRCRIAPDLRQRDRGMEQFKLAGRE